MIFRFLILTFLIFGFGELCPRTISREYLFDSSTTATPTTTRPITGAPVTGEPATNNPVTDEPATAEPATDEPATDEPATDATEAPVILCETCDISTIAPTLTDSATAFTSKELSATGECKTTQVKCARTDDQLCTDVKMTVIHSLLTDRHWKLVLPATDVTATLACAKDGTYSSGTITGITELAFEFTGCAPPKPCTLCDVSKIVPTNMAAGTSFEQKEMAYPCKQAEVTCSRTDSLLCQSIALLGNGIPFATVSESRSVNNVVYCGEDATYSSGPAKGITQLSCEFDMCEDPTPCDACDITTIAPSSIEAGTRFQHRDEKELNGCRQIYVFCQQDDSKVCSTISIKATLPSGTVTLKTESSVSITQDVVLCRNGFITEYEKREAITALSFEFDACV